MNCLGQLFRFRDDDGHGTVLDAHSTSRLSHMDSGSSYYGSTEPSSLWSFADGRRFDYCFDPHLLQKLTYSGSGAPQLMQNFPAGGGAGGIMELAG